MSEEGWEESRVTPSSSPTLAELRADVAKVNQGQRRAQRHFERRFEVVSVDAQRGYEHLKGLRAHYAHKSRWSTFLMWTMGPLLGFQSVLLGMVGFRWWNFTDCAWLLPALMVQNLAAIIGLAVVVVKALFADIEALKLPASADSQQDGDSER